MEMLRTVVAVATPRAARSRPMRSLRALLVPTPGKTDEQRGQGLAEYALILALLAIVAIASLIFLGDTITGMFEDLINAGFTYVLDLING